MANVGARNAAGFRIGMSAQRQNGTVRNEEFSLPLGIPKGGSTEVLFRLGCGWVGFGAVTARTDPSLVLRESTAKTANTVETVGFGDECVEEGSESDRRQRPIHRSGASGDQPR